MNHVSRIVVLTALSTFGMGTVGVSADTEKRTETKAAEIQPKRSLSPSSKSAKYCQVCALVENSADEVATVTELQKLSVAELSLKDESGKNAFYWAIYFGRDLIRDTLVARLGAPAIYKSLSHEDLVTDCAFSNACSSANIERLVGMGFQMRRESVIASVSSSEGCSTEKLSTLLKLGAPIEGQDASGNGVLHRIVDRSREGRPLAPRDCLVQSIRAIVARAPRLRAEKNLRGLTPVQLAEAFQRDQREWGTGLRSQDLDPIILALK